MSILVLPYLSSAVFRRGKKERQPKKIQPKTHPLVIIKLKKRRNSCSEQNKHINTNVPQCAITQARTDSCPLLITLAWRLSSILLCFFYSDNFSNFYCLYFWSCCIPVLPYATTKLFKHRFFPPPRAWSGLVRRSYGCSLGQRETIYQLKGWIDPRLLILE